MEKIKLLLRKKSVWAVIAIIVIGGGYYYNKTSAKLTPVRYVTAAVQTGTITSSVTGTGQVAVSDQVDVKPQGSGTVTSVRVHQGDQVKAGQVIATVDAQSAVNQINQAKVTLMQAQANYDKVIAGATNTDLATAKLSLQSAQQAVDNAKNSYDTSVSQQKVNVANAQSAMFNAGLTALPGVGNTSTATFTVSGTYTSTDPIEYKINFSSTGGGIYYNVSSASDGSNGFLNRGVPAPLGTRGLYFTISTTGTLSGSDYWTIDLPNTQSSSYLNAYNSYQAALQTQIQATTQANNAIQSAQNNLAQAQINFDAKVAPATQPDLLAAQSQIESAKVQLANANTAYQNTLVTAPFDGIIAKLTIQKGDQASNATAAATVITKQKIAQVTLNEVDVAKVKIGQKATLTFPAVDGLTITGDVGEVDSLGTVTQNVVNFSMKILFDTQDDRVKPGMSVSAAIITDVKQDVLTVPSAAVKGSGDTAYVETLVNGGPEQHSVTVGISSDTDTEISGDIKEGDQVITQTISASSSTAKPAASSGNILQSLGGSGATGARRTTGAATGGFGK
ncbi:MAG: hypothetical protein JWO40_321 [Candidatus Doudnabacteria bacterium]|nr:hypothetical protein [Candidatus Doudnabacteria bacterium]